MSPDQLRALSLSFPAALVTVSVAVLLFSGYMKGYLGRREGVARLRREERRWPQARTLSRLGGIPLVLSFLIGWWLVHGELVLSAPLTSFLAGAVLLFLVGFWDDLRPLPWPLQLLAQLSAALMLVLGGVRIELVASPWGGALDLALWGGAFLPSLAVMIWVPLCLNVLNWIDGLDGLLGSVTMVGFLALWGVTLFPSVNQPALSLLLALAIGSCLAFLLFNWYPATVLAGTSGAYFLGFTLATGAVLAGAKLATTLLVLAIPIVDGLWVIGDRLRSGVSIFAPDVRHLHYRLLERGWGERRIVLVYTGITLGLAGLALLLPTLGKILVFLGSVFLLTLWCAWVGGVWWRSRTTTTV